MGENIYESYMRSGVQTRVVERPTTKHQTKTQTNRNKPQRNKKPKNLIKKRAEDLNRYLSKQEIRMATKHIENVQHH